MKDILLPLVLTLALEIPIALLWGLRKKDLALCVLVNLLTNPLANLLYLYFPEIWVPAVLECAVVAAEWFLYRSFGERIKRPLALSLSANAASFFLGGVVIIVAQLFGLRWFI